MEETKLSQDQLEIIESNNGLRQYLSGLLTGKEATPRSNLYKLAGKTELLSTDEVLARWKDVLSTSLSRGSAEEKRVFQFDLHQLEKWGPQGAIDPIRDLLKDHVYPSFTSGIKATAFESQVWEQSKRNAVRLLHTLGCRGLAPVSYEHVVDDMRARDTLESNSGWPLFTKRKQPEVVKQAVEAAMNGEWRNYPAIALFRNYNQKTRLVWMFPMSVNLVEGSFFQPMLHSITRAAEAKPPKLYGKTSFFAPWVGFDACRRLISEVYNHQGYVAASDFSATDEHFKLAASMEVFDVIQYCFQPRYRSALKESLEYMHRIPLIIGPDTMLLGEHGVSSGSNWTNFVETIFDLILSEYVCLMGYNTWVNSYYGLYAIGDDMSWFTPHYNEEFAKALEKWCYRAGQVVKAEKTTNLRDEVTSLQRLFMRGYFRPQSQVLRAVYPTIRALKSLVFPERFHRSKEDGGLWTKDMEAVRTFMILENCCDHPCFKQFCEFVSKGDPNLKVVARLKASKLKELTRTSRLIPGLNTTYNQERRDQDLSQFDSLRIIKDL